MRQEVDSNCHKEKRSHGGDGMHGEKARPETIAQNDLRPKCERLAVRENEIRHREFRVDQLQHLSTNFVH
jgi:hypothetical protein